MSILTLDYREEPNDLYYDQGLNTAKLTFNRVKCEVWKSLMYNMEKD